MTTPRPLRIGTRGSALALVQARHVQAELAASGIESEIEIIVTEGDRRAPDTAWGEGAFVGAIVAALLACRVDVAVHSVKDVPTDEDPRLTIAAFLPREDPRDVLVAPAGGRLGSLDELPFAARVGTDSPRRGAFLRSLRPDLRIVPIHGNVDTRLRRLDEGSADALVLAAAGLRRLGRADRISVPLEAGDVPPAPGQGALAVQVRSADERAVRAVGTLDSPSPRPSVVAERALLHATGGGCRSPIGTLAVAIDGEAGASLRMTAGYARTDGTVRAIVGGDGDANSVAALVDDVLRRLAEGATRAAAGHEGAPRILVTRPADQAAATSLALVDRGFAPLVVPAIEVDRTPSPELVALVREHAAFDWIVVTSANAVRAIADAADAAGTAIDARRSPPAAGAEGGPRWAAVGGRTAAALVALGVRASYSPARATGAELADGLPDVAGRRVLVPRGDLADPSFVARLRDRGAEVVEVVAYRTTEAPASSVGPLADALAAEPVGWVATSPSSVRGTLRLADAAGARRVVETLPLVAIGPSTAAEARRQHIATVVEAESPSPAAIADAAATLLQRDQVIA